MKNVSEMPVKQIVSILGDGFKSKASIEGNEQTKQSSAQIMVRIGLDIHTWYLNKMSEMHQKLGTFSWYKPRCTGNIASSTLFRLSHLVSQGSQIMAIVVITIVA